MERRKFIVSSGTAASVVAAGCLSVLGMDGYESEPGGVDQDVLDETGYVKLGVVENEVEEEFSVQGVSEEVDVTNHSTMHLKTLEVVEEMPMGSAVFNVFISPKVGVSGVNINPIDRMDVDEIVSQVVHNYRGFEDIEYESEEEVNIRGESMISTRYTS